MDDKITFLDFETTGFTENRAVSLAIVHYNKGERISEKYYMINPRTHIEYRAREVHGIRDEDVEDKPNFYETWGDIQKYIEGCTIVAHNAQYDMRVLSGEMERYGIECGEIESLCTCQNARRLKLSMENYKLNTVCKYYGIQLRNHHNALTDAIACEKIFFKLINEGNLVTKKHFTK